ncbi:putative sulfite reductase-associated electron transfer protein DsrJ [Desulfonauticus submarinus]|uniref:Putative sulfite reductase-associated electron transfer protein DsrJ n=1 Tax=Desulfonauticus submarinus TaxID=206665 RepID=A0A1H0CJZ9_9BACT|nr:sulfate reduction electron transfer complex DsrMKJOP subunit DsrJ [Desulfonauticus submarinus]SDN58204.1 putative sulfite reductase-associated electron transfer protein DsrJ [Desulfonauticus submarinus]
MYDGGKILAGLAIFVALFTFPFWYNIGSAAYQRPKLEQPKSKACVESVEFMRADHMQLLNEWRDMYVREHITKYKSRLTGKEIHISLSKTCMKCHESKEKFCDQCHTSLAVSPYCWDCHVAPKGEK